MAGFANNVYIVWWDNSLENEEIVFRRSTDGGASFEPLINLSNDLGSSSSPSISVSGNNVYVVWIDENPLGGGAIFFRTSFDGGINFGTSINLSDNEGNARDPSIASVGENVHVSWEFNNNQISDIFYRRSINGGVSFDSIMNISNNVGLSSNPAISTIGNNIYIVWQDTGTYNDAPENYEIFYTKSTDTGANFESEFSNLSNNVGFSFSPSIASTTP